MTRLLQLVTIAALLTPSACTKQDASQPPANAAAPILTPSSEAPPTKSARELFGPKLGELAGPLQTLKLGMPCDAAGALTHAKPDFPSHDLPGYENVSVTISCDDASHLVDHIRVSPRASGADLRTWLASWGSPHEMTSFGKKLLVVDDAANRMRATIEDAARSSLTLQPLLPATELLGSTKGRLAIEGATPILGATKADLVARFAAFTVDAREALVFIDLPTTDFSLYPPKLQIGFKDNIATSFTLHIPIDGAPDAATTAARTALETAYGPLDAQGEASGPPKVRLEISPSKSLSIDVGD